ncbi:hypothetical protein [Mucilaginibacter pedocola]|uniref:Addiction module protein n=1 Tax=Mucilaginibacter pedocola TaxID=1792845 RepID=A0A1S9PDU2_9SPHI|nr:hypothetical protein [Mucilaginibacter pedocola]OOQ59132.1 hypothetical protein BC343_29355 [Mucilaginibacter pedocola]
MTTTAKREKLHALINNADDKKVDQLYLIWSDEPEESYDWQNDKAFLAELDDRVMRVKTGVDRGVTLEEFKRSIELRYKR